MNEPSFLSLPAEPVRSSAWHQPGEKNTCALPSQADQPLQALYCLAGNVRNAGRPSASQSGLILRRSCHLTPTDPICLAALCMVSPSLPMPVFVTSWVLDAGGPRGF